MSRKKLTGKKGEAAWVCGRGRVRVCGWEELSAGRHEAGGVDGDRNRVKASAR